MTPFKIQFQKSVTFNENSKEEWIAQIKNDITAVVLKESPRFSNKSKVEFNQEQIKQVEPSIKTPQILDIVNWNTIQITSIKSSQSEFNTVVSWEMETLLTSDIYECISITDNNFICLSSKDKKILLIPTSLKALKVH